MARVDASVAGGFDWVKSPGLLETYVSQRLSSYGQLLTVKVTPVSQLPGGLFGNRFTARVSFNPSTNRTTEEWRTIIADAFTSWNGIPATVAITSSGEARQPDTASPFSGLQTVLLLGAVIAVALVARDFSR